MRRYILLLILLGAVEISLALYLTFWREHFWNSIANKESIEFLYQLGIFIAVALCICLVTGMSGYLVTLTAIRWRAQLNETAVNLNLAHNKEHENIPQRIQEDCRELPLIALDLCFGSLKAVVYIVVFSTALLLSFSWVLLGIILLYSLAGTWITKKVATPLIALNYNSQRAEATYRTILNDENFTQCVKIMLGIARKQKHLSYTQTLYNQIGVVLPLIIIAPVYFTTQMPIGVLMRFNSTGATILENMSYGINSFVQINRLLACRRRLKEIGVI